MKKLLIMLFLACLGYTHTMAQSIHSVELNDGKHLNNTKFSDNWYFGVNGGGLFAWGNAATKADFLDRFGATGGLQLGKKVSTAGEVRLQALYGYNKGYYIPLKKSYGFNEISLSLDWLPNFTNIFYGYKEDRRCTFSGVLGIGGSDIWGRPYTNRSEYPLLTHKYFLFAKVGLRLDYALKNDKYHLNAELTNSFYPSTFDGAAHLNTPKRTAMAGHANLMVGFTYHFKNSDGSRNFTYSKGLDQSKYDNINDEINRLKTQIEEKKKHPNIQINKVNVETKTIYTTVAFPAKNNDIEFSQKPTMYNIAKNANVHDNDVVYISRKKTTGNVELFNSRAEAVKKELIDNWNVAESKIVIEDNADNIEKDNSNSKNISYVFIND